MRLIIILGYTLNEDGSIQLILKSRLDEALSIHEKTDIFLVCGKRPPKMIVPMRCETVTEAETMKQYLIANKIPVEDIIKEEQSITTFGNAFYSLDFVKKLQPESIIIIANEFHKPLIKYSFNKAFGKNYLYNLHTIPDYSLNTPDQEIKEWKRKIKHMVKICYPILFSEVKDGDINAIKSIIEGPRNLEFESSVKTMLNLEESIDRINIISE